MPAPLTIAARRAMVKELLRQEPGISARQIAGRLGVGKDAIRRDLAAIESEQRQPAPQQPPAEPEPAPDAPQRKELDAPDAPPAQPGDAPDADRLSVAYDDQLRAGLAMLARAGHAPEDAVRLAVAVLARAYEGAWKFRLYPQGVAPRVRVVDLYPYDPKGQRP
ncbi:helix-turn-helix domain-containing protein [Streptomyces sp. NPDC004237]|uniref:helix-turn-helix domain-containing protein n=1 Tax=Streptomyces sp. NPDC004237 TaxID=3154455 RepID=UPI0033BBF0E7